MSSRCKSYNFDDRDLIGENYSALFRIGVRPYSNMLYKSNRTHYKTNLSQTTQLPKRLAKHLIY